MAIGSGYADSIFSQSNFLRPNNFDFFFEDAPEVQYNVRSITLPFNKLQSQATKSGVKYYSGIEFVQNVTVSFLESTDLRVLKFLKTWFDQVFDPTSKRFRAQQTGGVSIFKTGILSVNITDTGTAFLGQIFNSAVHLSLKDKEIIRFVYNNLRPLTVEDLSWSYDNDSNLLISASFVVDDIDIQIF